MKKKLSAELVDNVLDLISKGHTIKAACAYSDIGQTVYYNWMKQGRADADADVESDERRLFDGVPDAEAKHEQAHLNVIIKATKKTWQAAAWYLERRYPERYGRRVVSPEHDSGDTVSEIG
jgi:transposase-like protein